MVLWSLTNVLFAWIFFFFIWLENVCFSPRNFALTCKIFQFPEKFCSSLHSPEKCFVLERVFVSCSLMQKFCEGDFASECRVSLGNVKHFQENGKDIFFLPLSNIFFITISLWGSVAFCFGLVQILTFRCSSSFLKCRHISYFSVQTHTRYMLACLVLASGHILSPEHR